MIIGVCGYGFTGSGAVKDLLKEYREISYNDGGKTLEFSLPYEPDGLLDLEYHLTKAPAKHLKGDTAVRRYKQLVKWYEKSYNRATDKKFSLLTEEYLSKIIQVEYKCHILQNSNRSKLYLFKEKALGTIQSRIEKRLKRFVPIKKEGERYISVYPDDFASSTKEYVNKLIDALCGTERKLALLDQPFPPNNPEDVFHFFDDPYAIVINRDPRDIYVIVKHLRFSTARFIPHDTVEDFVNYYKNIVRHRPDNDPTRVLRIRFEDLIYEYGDTVKRIESFLKISDHAEISKYFDPDESIMNTNMRNLFPEDKEAMEYIEKELSDYLFPFEKYKKCINREKLFDLAAK